VGSARTNGWLGKTFSFYAFVGKGRDKGGIPLLVLSIIFFDDSRDQIPNKCGS